MNKWKACGFLLLLFCSFANGQDEVIDTIYIAATPLRLQEFGGNQEIIRNSTNISDALDQNTSVFIKNYGPGSLSTSSIRGGSANHTLVLWNDLPIQNPFLGLLDLSLLNTWSADKITLQKGGNSAMWGSGAIGGVINIQNAPQKVNKVYFENLLTIGSFEKIHEQAKLSYNFGSIKTNTSISFLKAKNNFPYTTSGDLQKTQENAAQKQDNFSQDIFWDINSKNQISLFYWYAKAYRESPPTTVQNKSEAHQEDLANRISVQWKYLKNNQKLKVKTAFFSEDLNYSDPLTLTKSFTHFETVILDADYERYFKNQHIINVGISQFYTTVNSPANYKNTATESKTAVFFRYQYKWIQLSARQELVDNKDTPIMPSLAFEIPLNKTILAKGKISRNYRLPTLNDRFWVPGGNPELLAESGWSQEATLTYKKEKTNLTVTAFNRRIDNWIQWTLIEGGSFFQPYNLNKVWSRGLETEFKLNHNIQALQIEYILGYDYILSTNTIAVKFPKIEAGDQLFYTPVHAGLARIQLIYRKIILNYHQRYIGKTKGINEDLSAFSIAGATIGAQFRNFDIYLKANNIWNAQYRIIERRPMPGRNFELGIKLKIKK